MFIEHNQNPNGGNIDDCVIRAISFATGLDYWKVFDDLCEIADEFDCNINTGTAFITYLSRLGYEPREFTNKITVSKLANSCDSGTAIILVNGHVTCIKDGNIYDTWNCGRYKCQLAWVVK